MKEGASSGYGRGSRLGRGSSAAAVLAGLAIFASACGGSAGSTPPSSGASRYSKALAYAQCMRSHGIPNFPNPTSSGQFLIQNKNNSMDQSSPQFISANKACQKLLPNGGQLTQAQQAQQQADALKFAQCIRAHGFPKFPDPTANGNGSGTNFKALGIDIFSPQFQSAKQTCQRQTGFGAL